MSRGWRNPEYRKGCYRPMPVEVNVSPDVSLDLVGPDEDVGWAVDVDFNADARCVGCGGFLGASQGSLCQSCRVESFYDFRGDYLGSRNS